MVEPLTHEPVLMVCDVFPNTPHPETDQCDNPREAS